MIDQNNFLIIPEFILLDAIEKGLVFVKSDYQTHLANQTEEKSYLYRLLGGANIQRYNYFKQGKKVILAEEDDPRRLSVDLMYNMEINKVPSIYIALAAEQTGQNGIGLDQGYRESYYTDRDETDPENLIPGDEVVTFTRRMNTSYNIMIVSDNSNEVVMLYHFLRAMLLSLHPHLNLSGIENITMSGQDLQLYSDLIPKSAFMRAIGLNIQYEVTVPDLQATLLIQDVNFIGTPKDS